MIETSTETKVWKNAYLPIEAGGNTLPWFWLGTWGMGGEGWGRADDRESTRVLELAFEEGVRHFDTAGFYGHGHSEALLAKVLGVKRKALFISTKGGLVWEGKRVLHQATPKDLRQALTLSLQRLGTDYIDLFQLHWPDPSVPLQESLDALKTFQTEGLIRFWGVGNLSEPMVEKHFKAGERIPHQVHFNPLHRQDQVVLEAGRKDDCCLNCIISPFEQGLLLRPTRLWSEWGKKDVRRRSAYFDDRRAQLWVDGFLERVEMCSISASQLLLLWSLAQRGVDVVIPGARTVEHLREMLAHRSWLERWSTNPFEIQGKSKIEKELLELVGERVWRWLGDGMGEDKSEI